jgi:hypothetical protein
VTTRKSAWEIGLSFIIAGKISCVLEAVPVTLLMTHFCNIFAVRIFPLNIPILL